MIISTRGRYGLRAMIDIASQSKDKFVSLKEIAERQGISEHYLEKLIVPLKKNGFVRSIRGASGGYALNGDSKKITVADILRALEGPMYPVDCIGEGKDASFCGISSCSSCVTKPTWEKLFESINTVLESVNLYDLALDYSKVT
jgi:Rrf2 family protein